MRLKTGWKTQVSFMAILAIAMVTKLLLIHRAYAHGPLVAFVAALSVSWLPMQLIARAMEQRWLWPPSSQYSSFFWGDLLLLPGSATAIAVAYQRMPDENYLSDNPVFLPLCAVIGIVAGLVFRQIERKKYTPSQWNSPTKLYHDFVAVPVFFYYLLSGAPALFEGTVPGSIATILAAAIPFAVWLNIIATEESSGKEAHIGYNWARIRPG